MENKSELKVTDNRLSAMPLQENLPVAASQNDLIMKCDPEHIHIIESRSWTGYKQASKKTYNARNGGNPTKNQKASFFHKLAFPQYKQINHINGDGLDNRSINIRESSKRLFSFNKSDKSTNNTSGIVGVYYQDGANPRWKAVWTDHEGKSKSKSFSCAKYKEEAKNMAIECRTKEHELNLEILKEKIKPTL